jgi:putative membrane-bound dehydrogenase-like protein
VRLLAGPLAALFVTLAAPAAPAGPAAARQEWESLFDGTSLEGWTTGGDDGQWWSVEDGAIRGGSTERKVPHNTFLSTTESFQDFELTLAIRLSGEGFVNSGIQIRSQRSGEHEMTGYQVDAGDGWWGKLYDEGRRNRVLAESLDPAAVVAAVHSGDWNEYRILAEGPRIRSWINGVAALDHVEPDGGIPQDGAIGIQVHSGGPLIVEVRDVRVRRLPDRPGALTWARLSRSNQLGPAPPRPPDEERRGFFLAPGFEAELVCSEPEAPKVVDIAFDDAGRLWAITALEYPVDGNESPEAAGLYERGGRDRVLVIDEPWNPDRGPARVFAEGLAIPLAILPTRDAVYVGQGPQILALHDDDGDGHADRREVVLEGFGIQDSHLMPHRFVRAPGGWVYLAQGAFNSSRVVAKDGTVTPFDRCKVGRFRLDGSRFEVVGVGLNNIWGFVLDRQGNLWGQEANDLGYPVTPFVHGMTYPGIGMDRFRPHSPWQPPAASFRMGGTGLSGLARSQDRTGFPPPWNELFLVANPILNAIQAVRVAPEPGEHGEPVLTREADLLTSEDQRFRPVAIHFGPDGCLYVVDWYNPIISHNEVPRDHPERDKFRSRIWRIRHTSQTRTPPPDVSAVPDVELPALLDADTTLVARAAWHQIVERRASQLAPQLRVMTLDDTLPVETRLLAAWSLGDLERSDRELLGVLRGASEPALRREAARQAAALGPGPAELGRFLAPLQQEADEHVRAAAVEALGSLPRLDAGAVAILLGFLRPPVETPTVRIQQNGEEVHIGHAAWIALERSRVRAALEDHGEAVLALLDDPAGLELDAEVRRFAALCVGGAPGAARLAAELARLGVAPGPEELDHLVRNASEEVLRSVLAPELARPDRRTALLEALRPTLAAHPRPELAGELVRALRGLVRDTPTPDSDRLFLDMARELRLAELEGDVDALIESGRCERLTGLRVLLELGSQDAGRFRELASIAVPGDPLRRTAVEALAGVPDTAAFEALVELWPGLERGEKRAALGTLVASREGAERLLGALDEGDVEAASLDDVLLARLQAQLAGDPRLEPLQALRASAARPLLHLDGSGDAYAATGLTLEGPFTVEAWIQLDPGISNADGLLLSPGAFDLNFHDARPRLWLGPAGDVIVSSKRVSAEHWFHLALTRDAQGELSLYLDGELDQRIRVALPERFEHLDVGRTGPAAGTAGRIAEFRAWSVARSAAEIGADHRLALGAERPAGLLLVLPGDEVPLAGSARIEGALDAPPLETAEARRAELERFATFRALATAPGDEQHGRELFVKTCSVCHTVRGEGAAIGPVLDGVARKGTEGLLRAILTPNAGVESGYRTLIVTTRDGETLSGFLAAEDEGSILLRRQERADLRLPRDEIESLRFDPLSLMPEGLLEGLAPGDVTDLFAYLATLQD